MQRSSPFLAFDLGGTRIKAGLLDLHERRLLEVATVATPHDAQAALDELTRLRRELAGDEVLAGIGLAVPGLVSDCGTVVELPGKLPGLVDLPLRAELQRRLGAPATVCNDAVAYGIGEATHGAGQGHVRVVVVTLGTGVGVTVLEHGLPLGSGPLGGGILAGQLPIAQGDPRWTDSSGRTGTIEACCRARRLVDYANAAGGAFESVPDVLAAWTRDEPPACQGVATFREHLERALTALAVAYTPSIVVVGGGPLRTDHALLQGLDANIRAALWSTHALELAPASLGDGAALLGCAEYHIRTVQTKT